MDGGCLKSIMKKYPVDLFRVSNLINVEPSVIESAWISNFPLGKFKWNISFKISNTSSPKSFSIPLTKTMKLRWGNDDPFFEIISNW